MTLVRSRRIALGACALALMAATGVSCDDAFTVTTEGSGGAGGSTSTGTAGTGIGGSVTTVSSGGQGGGSSVGAGGSSGGSSPRHIPDSATPYCATNTNDASCSTAPGPQDGSVLGLAPSIIVSGGRFIETVSGVEYANADNNFSDWAAAVTHCEGLADGGFNDWRVPTWPELAVTADMGISGFTPTGLMLTEGQHWVRHPNPMPTHVNEGWVYFSNSATFYNPPGEQALLTRCVRGPVLATAFVEVAAGEYDESLSNFHWSLALAPQAQTWEEAVVSCPAPSRLPTAKEAVVLIMPGSPVTTGEFWTGTPLPNAAPPTAFSVDPGNGVMWDVARTELIQRVCVTPL